MTSTETPMTFMDQQWCVEIFVNEELCYTSKSHPDLFYVIGLYNHLCKYVETNIHEWHEVEVLIIRTKKHGRIQDAGGKEGVRRYHNQDYIQDNNSSRRVFHR